MIGSGRQPGSVSENISFHFLPQGRIWWEQWEKAVIFGIKNYKIAHNCRLHGCIGLKDRIIITGGISTASLWHFFRIQIVNDGEITWPGHGEYHCVTLSNCCSHFNVHLSSIDDMKFDLIQYWSSCLFQTLYVDSIETGQVFKNLQKIKLHVMSTGHYHLIKSICCSFW